MLFGERIQVTGRSCEVRDNIETEVESTGTLLSDILKFTFNGTLEMTESCLTSNGIITNDWVFEQLAYIELPISCSIKGQLWSIETNIK